MSSRVGRAIVTTTLAACGLAASVAVATPGAHVAKKNPKSLAGTYLGLTSQFQCPHSAPPTMCGAVNVVVSKSQRSIKKFLIGWEANCSTTGQVMDEVTVAHGPGNLSRRWLSFFSDQDFTVDLGNGSHAQGHITYHGRLSRRTRKGSGDFNITFAVVDPSGAQVDTCSTGQVTWTANPVKKGS